MARTAVAYTKWLGNSHLTDVAGTTADQANGHVIAAAQPDRTMLRVKNTAGSAANAVIKAGDYPPAIAAGVGDLTVSVAASGTEWIGPLESGRFIRKDGTLLVDLGSGFTGTVTAFLLPKSV